jgi:hypothetical protein
MNLLPAKARWWLTDKAANILEQIVPVNILGRLSGIGEPPQFGNAVTLKDIQSAIQSARVGETYYLFALFRDMIENDTHLQAEIGKRIMSFIGQQQTIEPEDKSNQDDVAAAELIRDMIANCDNWRQGCLHLANGHIWPVAASEKIYESVPMADGWKWKHPVRYRLKQIHPVPYALFTYKVAYWNVNNTGIQPMGNGQSPMPQLTNSGSIPITDGRGPSALNYTGAVEDNVLQWNPDDWEPDLRFYNVQPNGLINWTLADAYRPNKDRHVIHRANVATASMKDNYGGLLGGQIFNWFLKQQGRDWFARAMERYGSPFAVAYARTQNKNILDELYRAFDKATKVNALIVPPQSKIELKEIMVSGMADGFAKFHGMLCDEETKGILGQTLSTTAKGTGMGSGVSELQGEVRAEWTQFDKHSFGEMECEQIFYPFLRINGYRGRLKSARIGHGIAAYHFEFPALEIGGMIFPACYFQFRSDRDFSVHDGDNVPADVIYFSGERGWFCHFNYNPAPQSHCKELLRLLTVL